MKPFAVVQDQRASSIAPFHLLEDGKRRLSISQNREKGAVDNHGKWKLDTIAPPLNLLQFNQFV